MSRPTKPRVLIVLERPTQHFSEGFRLAADSAELEASVLYWNDDSDGRSDPDFGLDISWDVDLHLGYPWRKVEEGRFVSEWRTFAGRCESSRPTW